MSIVLCSKACLCYDGINNSKPHTPIQLTDNTIQESQNELSNEVVCVNLKVCFLDLYITVKLFAKE